MNFTNLNPFSNDGATTIDGPTNFGWEYVWHCHILGHEENDMMRPIMWQVPPNTPGPLTVAANLNGGVDISFTDNSASETGFTVQRDIDPAFPNPTTIQVAASPTRNVVGEGVDYGSMISVERSHAAHTGTTYYYRVQAIDDGFNTPYEQLYNPHVGTALWLVEHGDHLARSDHRRCADLASFRHGCGGQQFDFRAGGISNTGTATLTISRHDVERG